MLGLYAVGASLLGSLQHASLPGYTGHPAISMVASRPEESVKLTPFPVAEPELDCQPLKKEQLHSQEQLYAFPHKMSKKSRSEAKSFDLLTHSAPMPDARQPLMQDFSFNASKLGISGEALQAELPPSPLSSGFDLRSLQDENHAQQPKGWLHYLQASRSRPSTSVENSTAQKGEPKQKSWSRLPAISLQPRREQRSASAPETGTSNAYLPARLGHVAYMPPKDGSLQPRSRSMSLDVPRLARKSFNNLRLKKSTAPKTLNDSPKLDASASSQERWDVPHVPAGSLRISLSDLPRESESSSDSDYDYDRRHSISGSSGHDGYHARSRGQSGGSCTSTAPTTLNDVTVMSAFSMSTAPTGCSDSEDDEDDDEDDIEWETPARRASCVSPTGFSHTSSPASPIQYFGGSSAPTDQHATSPIVSAPTDNHKKLGSKGSFTMSMLRRPRRMASSSSLGAKSAESNGSFSERARRSFSQARSLLTVPSPPRAPRPSTADSDAGRPRAVYLQPINTGVISRPCQTTPNPVASTRSNSMMTGSTTNTVETGSLRYPSFYMGTSSDSGSVTGGSSGGSSGRSWESTAPELAALEELVLTECKYLADLQLLLDVYVEGLKRLGLITPASLTKILSNLDEVMAFSRFLIDCIRSFLPRRTSPPTSISSQPGHHHGLQAHAQQQGQHRRAGDDRAIEPDYLGLSTKLVRELPARMEVYARYCVGYQGAKERLEFERDLRPAVATFIELARTTNPALQGMDMAQFLVLPVQRVTRYPLLFGCLAKECGKRRTEENELREEDEDVELGNLSDASGGLGTSTNGDTVEQRRERAKAIHNNWIRLRDVSASICGITNLAISYQQQGSRPDSTRPRVRPSVSSPRLSPSVTQFGGAHMASPPPPAMVRKDESVGAIPSPPPSTDSKPRSTSFSFASLRKSKQAAVAERSQSKAPASMAEVAASTAGITTSSSSSESSASSSSLFGRFLRSFRNPTPSA